MLCLPLINMELHSGERFIILSLRAFDFLRGMGFVITSLSCYSPAPGLRLTHPSTGIQVMLAWEDGTWFICIKRVKWLSRRQVDSTALKSMFGHWYLDAFLDERNMEEVITLNAAFTREHLMTALDGTGWLDTR